MHINAPDNWSEIKLEATFDNEGHGLPNDISKLGFVNDAQKAIQDHIGVADIMTFDIDNREWYYWASSYAKATGCKFRLPRKKKKRLMKIFE